MAAQLKQFMDQAGRLWQEGKLADKVATAFTASMTTHGGQESTILALSNTLYHWGMLILPLGYTASEVFNAGGNPYGTSYTSGKRVEGPDEKTLAVARYQGQRLARYAAVVAAAREADAFRVKRPRPERFRRPRSTETAAQPSRCSLGRSVCDQSGAATVGCEAERPADEDEQSVLEADQVPEVDEQPGRPGEKAAEPDAFDVGDCRRSPDRGQVAFVAVAERAVGAPS